MSGIHTGTPPGGTQQQKTGVAITSHLLITQVGSHISYIYIYSLLK